MLKLQSNPSWKITITRWKLISLTCSFVRYLRRWKKEIHQERNPECVLIKNVLLTLLLEKFAPPPLAVVKTKDKWIFYFKEYSFSTKFLLLLQHQWSVRFPGEMLTLFLQSYTGTASLRKIAIVNSSNSILSGRNQNK